MAEWLLWIRDYRTRRLTAEQIVEQISDPLSNVGLRLVGNPMQVIPVQRHPFEWTLRLVEKNPEGQINVTDRASSVLETRRFGVLAPAQKQRPLPRNRPAPRGT